ncbi:MAG TPA: hypothetical protein VGP72_26580 [Planctomycetota bacterium]|jgi:hypothetical protein
MLAEIDPARQQALDIAARQAYWDHVAQYGFTLWWVGLAFGILLIAFYLVLPVERAPDATASGRSRLTSYLSRWRVQFGHAGAILLLILCAIHFQLGVDKERGFIADRDERYRAMIDKAVAGQGHDEALRAQYMYMPKGNSLVYMSLGNPSLAADYLWLTSQHYVSNSFRRGEKFEILMRFYDTILKLDPHWVEIHVNAGKVLSALEPNRYAVEKFYMRSIFENPGNLKLLYEAGRLFVVPPANPELRQEYSHRAVGWFQNMIDVIEHRQMTPGMERQVQDLKDLIGRLAVESKAYEVAYRMLRAVVMDKTVARALRAAACREMLNAHGLLMVNMLQTRVNDWKKEKAAYPADLRTILEQLRTDPVFEGVDPAAPHDPFGMPILYDPATGTVRSKGVDAKRAIQANAVISAIINSYRMEHADAQPATLQELQEWVVPFYKRPGNEAGPAVLDAIGAKLEVVNSPFGEPWKYDAKEGKIILPPECDPKVLFKNVERILGPEE